MPANDGADSAPYRGPMRLAWAGARVLDLRPAPAVLAAMVLAATTAVIPESTVLTSGKDKIADGDHTGFCHEQAADRSWPRQIV